MNAMQIIEGIPFLGGKLSQLDFVVAREMASTVVNAKFDKDKIIVKMDTQERCTDTVMEGVMLLLGLTESPDVFWQHGAWQCACWVINEKEKEEIIKKLISEMPAIKFVWQK